MNSASVRSTAWHRVFNTKANKYWGTNYMCAVDRLNIYPPYTKGFVLVGDRYSRKWVSGLILGRINGHRRVATETGMVFIEHQEQFHLRRPWVGTKPYGLGRI